MTTSSVNNHLYQIRRADLRILTFLIALDYRHQSEINKNNPLGTGGAVVSAYARLIQRLYSPSLAHAYGAREVKYQVSLNAPEFSGYIQCDAQELLAFLLDGIHEDLNRVKEKPYVPNPEWTGGGDEALRKLANDFWSAYKKRNDSVIVDLFQGQYQSTLTCNHCQHVSISHFHHTSSFVEKL